MKFELVETTVRATEVDLRAMAREAIDLAKKTEVNIYFESRGIEVGVSRFDTEESLLDKWHIAFDFFGLGWRKRRMLYRAYIEEELSMEEAAKTAGVNTKVARLYIKKKGWMRPKKFWVDRGHFKAKNHAGFSEVVAKAKKRKQRG